MKNNNGNHKKSKWKKISIILLVMIMMLIGIGLVGYNIASDYLASSMLKSYLTTEIDKVMVESTPEGEKPIGLDEMRLGDLLEQEKSKVAAGKQEEQVTTEGEGEQAKESTTATAPTKQPSVLESYVEKLGPEATLEDVVQDITSSIPSKDKQQMMGLVLGNLSGGDMQYLMGLVSDGISGQDLAEAKALAYSRFNDEDIALVKGFYEKYQFVIP